MALAAGMLAGCSKEPAAENQIQTVDHDQVRYLNVTISSPTGMETRATTADDDFTNGTEDENFVENMTFVFYDAAGLPTGQAVEKKFTANTDKEGFNTSTGIANVEKIWSSTVEVALSQGENLPAYVVAYINPVSDSDLKTNSLKQIDEITRQQVRVKSKTEGSDRMLFPMSNSVYYGDNPVAGETNVRVFASPVATDQLYTSPEDAEAATAKTIDIYVESYAARVQLKMTPGAVNPNATDVNGYTLTFVPEAWRVNATDKDTYAVKRFGIADGTSVNYDPTYSALLTNFNGSDWWNEPKKFRSYWACTPSYYKNDYPKVSDNITDVKESNDYSEGTKYPYDEHYFSYEQFKTGKVKGALFAEAITWDETNGFNKPFYARETTTASIAWGYEKETQNVDDEPEAEAAKLEYNPLATMPSAVIVGHYILTKNGTDMPQQTFYLYGKTNNHHNLYLQSEILDAMVKNQTTVLTREGAAGNYTYSAYREIDGFTVEHPLKAVRDVKNTTVAGRLVALQLTDEAAARDLYYYDAAATGDKYVKITAGEDGNLNKVNSELLSAGYATMYGNGIAYFNIPIEHLGIYATTSGSEGKQPIVPPVGELSYYISAKLNILSWRVVPTQEVKL